MSSRAADLDGLEIADPCPVSWDTMRGDERSRFCERCRLHVYDIAGLDREEAVRLVFRTEGRLCVRFFRRADGTILTKDCGRARAARLRKAAAMSVAFALAVAAAVVSGLDDAAQGATSSHRRHAPLDVRSACTRGARTLVPEKTIEVLRRSPLYGFGPFASAVDWVDQTLYPRVLMGMMIAPSPPVPGAP